MDQNRRQNPEINTYIPETGGSDDFISLLGPPPLPVSPNVPSTPKRPVTHTLSSPPPVMVTTPLIPTASKNTTTASTRGTLIDIKPTSRSWSWLFKLILVFGIVALLVLLILYLFTHTNLNQVIKSENSATILIPVTLLILGVFLIFGGYLLQKSETR